jgi:hypothetical protein
MLDFMPAPLVLTTKVAQKPGFVKLFLDNSTTSGK